MSDDACSIEFISQKLNLYQVIQLYLIGEHNVNENPDAIYAVLYSIINSLQQSINLKDINNNLHGNVSML